MQRGLSLPHPCVRAGCLLLQSVRLCHTHPVAPANSTPCSSESMSHCINLLLKSALNCLGTLDLDGSASVKKKKKAHVDLQTQEQILSLPFLVRDGLPRKDSHVTLRPSLTPGQPIKAGCGGLNEKGKDKQANSAF